MPSSPCHHQMVPGGLLRCGCEVGWGCNTVPPSPSFPPCLPQLLVLEWQPGGCFSLIPSACHGLQSPWQQAMSVLLQEKIRKGPGDKSSGRHPLARGLPREVMEWRQRSHTAGSGCCGVAEVPQPRGGVGCRVLCRNVLQLMPCDSLTRPPGTARADMSSSELSLWLPRLGVRCKQAARGTLSPSV